VFEDEVVELSVVTYEASSHLSQNSTIVSTAAENND